jgi:hypothetical protein
MDMNMASEKETIKTNEIDFYPKVGDRYRIVFPSYIGKTVQTHVSTYGQYPQRDKDGKLIWKDIFNTAKGTLNEKIAGMIFLQVGILQLLQFTVYYFYQSDINALKVIALASLPAIIFLTIIWYYLFEKKTQAAMPLVLVYMVTNFVGFIINLSPISELGFWEIIYLLLDIYSLWLSVWFFITVKNIKR